MTAHDCFEMGRQLYHEADYSYAVLWLHEAINRLNNNTNEFMQVSMVDILEYLAVSMYREGNVGDIDINVSIKIKIINHIL